MFSSFSVNYSMRYSDTFSWINLQNLHFFKDYLHKFFMDEFRLYMLASMWETFSNMFGSTRQLEKSKINCNEWGKMDELWTMTVYHVSYRYPSIHLQRKVCGCGCVCACLRVCDRQREMLPSIAMSCKCKHCPHCTQTPYISITLDVSITVTRQDEWP